MFRHLLHDQTHAQKEISTATNDQEYLRRMRCTTDLAGSSIIVSWWWVVRIGQLFAPVLVVRRYLHTVCRVTPIDVAISIIVRPFSRRTTARCAVPHRLGECQCFPVVEIATHCNSPMPAREHANLDVQIRSSTVLR